MQESNEVERQEYLDLIIEIEEKKHEYKAKRRPLIWSRNILFLLFLLPLAAIASIGVFRPTSYIGGWSIPGLIVSTILFIVGLIFFFLDYVEAGEEKGFKGAARIRDLLELKDEIEWLQIQAGMLKAHQTHTLSVREQYELYTDELSRAIKDYQRKANHNRWMYFILQMIIIACSLFVGGLTSGLTNLISIFGNHWIAPTLSFTVSFLTAMVTLFRPRERGYNLQQTADAIQYEIDCANRRIYGYKLMTDREAYTKLAEEVEKLRNEQRKRQQQLEQASEAKQTS